MKSDFPLPVVDALRSLSVFGVSQEGAYREHFADIAAVLGPDVPTKLSKWIAEWAETGRAGLVILTGNAGTGKTAVAQTYAEAVGRVLPQTDGLVELTKRRWLIKDLSGIPTQSARKKTLKDAVDKGTKGQVLVCANEGVLRRSLEQNQKALQPVVGVLDEALTRGAAQNDECTIVNVNRQRATADGLWEGLLEFLTRKELWTGCDNCPSGSTGCPMMENAAALRRPDVRNALRFLLRYSSGATIPTLRDVLSLLAWAIVGDAADGGGLSCQGVKDRTRDLGESAFDAKHAYFSLLFGVGLPFESVERSPLLDAIRTSRIGEVSDLEVDEWLRDAALVRNKLAEARFHTNRILTTVGVMSFETLGETLSTSEDLDRVEASVDALVDRGSSAMAMWRRKAFFEHSSQLGGVPGAVQRLSLWRYGNDLLDLSARCASGQSTAADLQHIVKGLNVLVTGFTSIGEGLIVPDSAGLFSRDPGAFSPPKPSVVHAQIPANRFCLRCPDRGLVTNILDIDFVEVEFALDDSDSLFLTIVPEMYECIREAEALAGPVGRGDAIMAELRDFYSRLAMRERPTSAVRIADSSRATASLVTVTLPQV
jgi:hypothetical protein